MEHNTVSRRGLFRALTTGARRSLDQAPDVTYIPGIGEIDSIKRSVPRPPKAIDEHLFQQICNGCGDCEIACPEQVISIEQDYACLNIDYGYCSQCGECGKVCLSGALHGNNSDIGLRPIFNSGCQNAIVGDCTLCADRCPKHAIKIVDFELPQIESSLCDGCSRCKQGCPFSAVSMKYETIG
ncbi:4Fe-4S dicluster domain-containing protein [Vibrio sp. FNV 38]|nr:4Fe-4S dicluster domain-containing protein [Vibrio sp. FNV 38]